MLDAGGIHARLRERFGEAVGALEGSGTNAWATVEPARIAEVCAFVRTDAALRFDCLSNLTGVDYPKQGHIQIVYHLFSYALRHDFVLKVDANRDDPRVASVSSVWATADWHEREAFDLLGVHFDGHPDLRRILMPEDWPGHPLRKDFVEPQEYHGIPTSRESLLKA
jgi:NADH-quinone oxidoreductase subunit C